MTVEYTAKPEDLAALLSYSLERSSKMRFHILSQSASAGFLWIVLDLLARRSVSPRTWITGALIAITTYFLFPLWFTLTAKRGKQFLTIDSERISTQIGRKSNEVPWTAIRNLWVTDQYIFIVGKNLSAFAIPRRAFQDDAGRNRFIRLCEEYWGYARSASH